MPEFFGTGGIFGSAIDAVRVGAIRTEDPEAWCLGVALKESGRRPMENEESELRILKSASECQSSAGPWNTGTSSDAFGEIVFRRLLMEPIFGADSDLEQLSTDPVESEQLSMEPAEFFPSPTPETQGPTKWVHWVLLDLELKVRLGHGGVQPLDLGGVRHPMPWFFTVVAC